MSKPQAGWFADPQDTTQQHFWDGDDWTEHRAPGPVPQAPSYVTAAPTAGGAVVALVLGVLSLFSLGLGALLGVPAIITGRRAVKAVDASGGRLGGRGLAQAGFVTGIIGTSMSVLAVVFVVVTFVLGAAVQSSYEDTCTTLHTGSTSYDTQLGC